MHGANIGNHPYIRTDVPRLLADKADATCFYMGMLRNSQHTRLILLNQ